MALVVSPISLANDIIKIDRRNALERTTKLEVTPQGIVIDFGSPVSSVIISHRSKVVFTGVDGALCLSKASCSQENPPTMLFVRKIPKIEFKDEEAMANGTSLLYVDTASGMYRFEFKPVSKNPTYTKVEINQQEIRPLISADEAYK